MPFDPSCLRDRTIQDLIDVHIHAPIADLDRVAPHAHVPPFLSRLSGRQIPRPMMDRADDLAVLDRAARQRAAGVWAIMIAGMKPARVVADRHPSIVEEHRSTRSGGNGSDLDGTNKRHQSVERGLKRQNGKGRYVIGATLFPSAGRVDPAPVGAL